MRLIESRVFDYVGYHGCHSRCDLRVFTMDSKYLVIATEREDNPGTSITNVAERLAWMVYRYLECPADFTWIEHYRDRAFIGSRPQFKEEFDSVTFTSTCRGFTDPRWKPISKAEVETLIGQPLDGSPEERSL